MKHLLLTTIAAVVLVGCGDPPTKHKALINDTLAGDTASVKQSLIAGANVNVKGGFLRGTALHYAAFKGNKEIAELLITNNADVNAKDKNGSTPMYMAAVEGRGEIIVLLLRKGADVNARDNNGSTPLDWAREENQDQIANLIHQYGGKTGAELKALGK